MFFLRRFIQTIRPQKFWKPLRPSVFTKLRDRIKRIKQINPVQNKFCTPKNPFIFRLELFNIDGGTNILKAMYEMR